MAETPQGVEVLAEGECPECHEIIEPKGKQSVAMALGAHRKRAHNVAGKYAERRGEKKPARPDDDEQPTPLRVLHNIGDAVGSGKRPPTSDQLANAGGKLYGYIMMFRAGRLVDSDTRLQSDEQRVRVMGALAPTEQEATAIANPFARALAKTNLNKTAGRAIVDNLDIADCVFAVLEVERRFGEYRRELKAHEAALAGGTVTPLMSVPSGAPVPGATVAPPVGSNADVDYARMADELGYLPAGAPHSPPMQSGQVISAADVAAQAGVTIELPPDVNTGIASTL